MICKLFLKRTSGAESRDFKSVDGKGKGRAGRRWLLKYSASKHWMCVPAFEEGVGCAALLKKPS